MSHHFTPTQPHFNNFTGTSSFSTPQHNNFTSRKRKFMEIAENAWMHPPSTWEYREGRFELPYKRLRMGPEDESMHHVQQSHRVLSQNDRLRKYNESVQRFYESMSVRRDQEEPMQDHDESQYPQSHAHQHHLHSGITHVQQQSAPPNVPLQLYETLGNLTSQTLSGCNKQNLLLLLTRLKSSVSLIQSQLEEHVYCVICMEKERKVICVPCGHLVCCRECLEGQEQCPVCREVIERKQIVYEG